LRPNFPLAVSRIPQPWFPIGRALAMCSFLAVGALGAEPILFDGFDDAGTRGWSATVPTSCTDGRKNGDETDVDCGGPSCVSCATVCPARPAGTIGGGCDSDADCGPDGLCFVGQQDGSVFAPEGYCMVADVSFALPKCSIDGDCASGELCVEWFDFFGYKHCMPSCDCDGEACPDHQVCASAFNRLRLSDAICTPGNANAVDGDACAGLYECDEFSVCVSDPEYPGGACERRDCQIGQDSSCNGGHCIGLDSPFAGTTCVAVCTGDEECRTDEGYLCFDPDGEGTATNYCRHPHVGDPCADAADCGGEPWSCLTGASYPGGYCTLSGCPIAGSVNGCSTGSICHDDGIAPANFCVDRCTGGGQGSCRTGYSCADIDPGAGVMLGCIPS